MKKSLIVTAFAAAFVLAGCQSQAPKSEAPAKSAAQMNYEAALATAKKAQKAAAAAGNEWRDTGKIIKSAEEAAAAGDFDKASKLAKKAEDQGHIAVSQAKENTNAGNPGYLY